MGIIKGDINAAMPVYVTRKTADGMTGSLSASIWMPLLLWLLFFLNGVFWGIVGLIEAVKVVF